MRVRRDAKTKTLGILTRAVAVVAVAQAVEAQVAEAAQVLVAARRQGQAAHLKMEM